MPEPLTLVATAQLRARLLVGVLVVTTLAFGGVYPTGFVPMLAVGGAVAGEILVRRTRSADIPRSLWAATLCWGACIAAQLIPLPRRVLVVVSPRTDALLYLQDLTYARGAAAAAQWHPLSIDPVRTVLGIVFVAVLVAVAFATAAVARESLDTFALGIVGLGLVLALVGIVDAGAGTRMIYGVWRAPPHTASFGPFFNRNHFGGWMIMAIAVAAAYAHKQAADAPRITRGGARDFVRWLSSDGGNRWLLSTFTIGAMVFAVVLTMSRSATTGVLLVVLAIQWMAARSRGHAAAASAIGMVVALSLFSPAFERVADRFVSGALLGPRAAAWSGAAALIRDFPLLGIGWNTYAVATLVTEPVSRGLRFDAAHNDYLQLIAECGFVGAAAALVLVWAFARGTLRRARLDEPGTLGFWVRRGAIVGLVGIALQELVDFSLQIPANALLCAIVCGLAVHVPARPMRSFGGRAPATLHPIH